MSTSLTPSKTSGSQTSTSSSSSSSQPSSTPEKHLPTHLTVSIPFLSKVTVRDVLAELASDKPSEIITIPSDSTVQGAVEILANNKILSAPIQEVHNKQYLGIIDMFDILRYIIKLYSPPTPVSSQDYPSFLSFWETTLLLPISNLPEINYLERQRSKYFSDSICKVLAMSPNALGGADIMITKDALLVQAVSLLASGLRRVLVVGEDKEEEKEGEGTEEKKVIGIISQYDLVAYLSKHLDMDDLDKIRVEHTGLGFFKGGVPSLHYILDTAHTLQGYYLMNYYSISAIPVLNKTGKLVGNLSISDLKPLKFENFHALTLPVMEYLQIYSPESIQPPVSINLTAEKQEPLTLADLIRTFTKHKIHRVWNVDKNGKVVGVISLSDIMRLLDVSWYQQNQ